MLFGDGSACDRERKSIGFAAVVTGSRYGTSVPICVISPDMLLIGRKRARQKASVSINLLEW